MATQLRGNVSDRIRTRSQELLGRSITNTELRLMAYVQYVMVNDQRIDPHKCNAADRRVLRRWKNEAHIEGGASGLAITREFWDIINDLIWLGYVDVSTQE